MKDEPQPLGGTYHNLKYSQKHSNAKNKKQIGTAPSRIIT